jgi:alkylhydroperoxidase family enzyme
MVRMLGIDGPEPEQIAIDYTATDLPLETKALLGFALKLTRSPTKISIADINTLRTYGYTDEQVLEAVVLVSYTKFANFLAFGLGTVPDFDSSRVSLQREAAVAAPVRF